MAEPISIASTTTFVHKDKKGNRNLRSAAKEAPNFHSEERSDEAPISDSALPIRATLPEPDAQPAPLSVEHAGIPAAQTREPMTTLFDTHAHLDDEQLIGDLDDVVARATAAGLVGIMAVATSADSAERCVQIANRFEIVQATVGIQPNYVAEAGERDWQRIVALADSPQVKAIGETGLDHYWDFAPIEIQREYFVRHVQLARRLQLPLVIHMRDPKLLDPQQADQQPCGHEILRYLREHTGSKPIQGIMHSFSGNAALAQECLAMGLHISFAGMVTYKKSHALREVAATIPPDRILIETDAPYLSPHPKRGQRPNEPALVMHTAECLAEVFGIGIEEFGRLTTDNAKRLFAV